MILLNLFARDCAKKTDLATYADILAPKAPCSPGVPQFLVIVERIVSKLSFKTTVARQPRGLANKLILPLREQANTNTIYNMLM